jgi:cytochrome c
MQQQIKVKIRTIEMTATINRFICSMRIAIILSIAYLSLFTNAKAESLTDYTGDIDKGRLVFAQCRTCHYPEKIVGHHNGPNLHGIFGKIAGKQADFDDYSETFKAAQFVWTEELLFAWLANTETMFPETTMMSLGVKDPQQRADLIAYLKRFR